MNSASTRIISISKQNYALELPTNSSKSVLVDVVVNVDGEEITHWWQFDWRAVSYIHNQNFYNFSLSGYSQKPSYNFKYSKSFFKITITNPENEMTVEETSDLVAPNYNEFVVTKDRVFQGLYLKGTVMVYVILQSYTSDNPPETAFKSMLDSGNLTDVAILTKSGTFPCHKFVLASASEYFLKMFSTDMKEKKESIVDWVGVFEADVVRDLLDYLYTGQTPSNSPNCMELMKVAQMCLMDRLMTMCGKRLKEALTVENVGETLRFAAKYEAEELQEAAVNFIVANFGLNDDSAAPWDMVEQEFGKNLATTIIKALVAKKIFLEVP